jgi:hypothetical protein
MGSLPQFNSVASAPKILNASAIFDESFENWHKQKIEEALVREINAQAPQLRCRFERGAGSLVNDTACR